MTYPNWHIFIKGFDVFAISYLSETTDIHGISKASGCLIVHRGVNALCERLNDIKFPTGRHELMNIKAGFFKIAKFPNVGIIDGTQIPIQGTSTDDEHLYVCIKGLHAINVQAVVDHDLRFLYISFIYIL